MVCWVRKVLVDEWVSTITSIAGSNSVTTSEALEITALTARDKPVDQSDADAIQATEVRASGYAHLREHQVRKNYKKIIWSVGILDKVILHSRRKRRGLSSLKTEEQPENPSMPGTSSSKEDACDFLK
ncbi:hypothetical protein AgCh_026068 [Apium graveolens]